MKKSSLRRPEERTLWVCQRVPAVRAAADAATVSNLFRELGSRIAAEDYDSPTFSIDLLAKDVRLATEMARAHGAPPILARSVDLLNEVARAQGLGKLDTAAMWKLYAGVWSGGTAQTAGPNHP